MKRVDELTLKLIDQSIDASELRELADLTQAGEARETLLRLMDLESHLQASSFVSTEDQVLRQIQQERCERVEAEVMRAVTQAEPATDKDAALTGSKKVWRSMLAFPVAATLALCLLIAFLVLYSGSGNGGVIAELHPHGSVLTVLTADGKPRLLSDRNELIKLRPGETIETSQATGMAEIVYPDGTKLGLLGETRVRLAGAPGGSKQISILSGLLQADVAPQPEGRPLRIVTQAATLEVLGTTLGVEVRDASTQLGVATGRVAMTRKADGQRVEVEAGRFARATESAREPLRSHPFPELHSAWSEDFESGLPAGWRTGEIVEHATGLAVSATTSKRSDSGRFSITSQNAWQQGEHALCRLDKHSVLHVRFRQDAFARITIMIGTRSYPPATGRTGGNLFYTKKAWNEELTPGKWKTVSVPLSDTGWQIKQGKRINGRPELDGVAAYLIHISTMKQDVGLTVDRMWITNKAEVSQF